MLKYFILIFILPLKLMGQSELVLNKDWRFSIQNSTDKLKAGKWYKATVPGTVHTDLLNNKLIPEPFYRDNEYKVQWVEQQTWIYQKQFTITAKVLTDKFAWLVFDGLDTHASVILNNDTILYADNMFRQWKVNVTNKLKKQNVLRIVFHPTAEIAKQNKAAAFVPYPDNERVFVRKAQYQFGWDWGPRLVTFGIWKDVKLITSNDKFTPPVIVNNKRDIQLITEKDEIGESFYFKVDGKPVFIKGANWIPADNFLPRVKKYQRYEQLIRAAKEANINMLRVWGGGVYEDDEFYDLCDKYDIMVWQDFMFAGALYPGDSAFLKNVEEEVRYQVNRLKHHRSIAIWCGNNEIEEAWFNWGWQKQFNYSASDSLTLWNNYKKIFHEIIPGILKELDPKRPYWPSSPSLGWGRDSAYKKGDVHYWGVWWGKEPVEKYNEKVGRFNSEYGMQGMPDFKTIEKFTIPGDRDTSSSVMKIHQKHPFGYENIKLYIENKFRTPKTFEDLVYVSQLMQADAIKTAIEAHRNKYPTTMGTMFWQWNDCWPVVSWSAIDYYGRKKALYYQVRRSYADSIVRINDNGELLSFDILINDSKTKSKIDQVFLSDFNGSSFDISSQLKIRYSYKGPFSFLIKSYLQYFLKIDSSTQFLLIESKDKTVPPTIFFFKDPKHLNLPATSIQFKIEGNQIELFSQKFAYGVYIDVPDGVELDDNYFHLLPLEPKRVSFTSTIPIETLKKQIRIKSLVDTY